MSVQDILGPLTKSAFVEQYYQKLPYSTAQRCEFLAPLGSWRALAKILPKPGVDLLVVRQGSQWEGQPPATAEDARALFDQGCTIVVRHAERQDEELAKLAAGFAQDFGAPVDLHLYFTPGGHFGFNWHFDAEDVFILQTEGSKDYLLRKNTVHPWPLAETIPPDMGYQHEIMPLIRCTLRRGDWLYIPGGYWHRAESQEDSISIAVGILSATAVDLYDFLRPRILPSLQWRQRLPVCGDANSLAAPELTAQYVELCQVLAADLARMMTDPALVRDYLASRGRASDAQLPDKPAEAAAKQTTAERCAPNA